MKSVHAISAYLQCDYLHEQIEKPWYGNRGCLGEIHVHWHYDDIFAVDPAQ